LLYQVVGSAIEAQVVVTGKNQDVVGHALADSAGDSSFFFWLVVVLVFARHLNR